MCELIFWIFPRSVAKRENPQIIYPPPCPRPQNIIFAFPCRNIYDGSCVCISLQVLEDHQLVSKTFSDCRTVLMILSIERYHPTNYETAKARDACIRFGAARAVFALSCIYCVLLLQIHFLYRDLQAIANITIINKYAHAYIHLYTHLNIYL